MGIFKDIRNLKRQADSLPKGPGLRETLKQAPGMMEQARQQLEAQQGSAELLESGIDGQATIKAIRDTSMTMNENPVVEFDLEVAAGGVPYDDQAADVAADRGSVRPRHGAPVQCGPE